jgi:hypothetical protein
MRRFVYGDQSYPLVIIEVLDHEKSPFRPSKWPLEIQELKTC